MATTNKGIYYPDDYTKLADVPNDMKKMAESINVIFRYNESIIDGLVSNVLSNTQAINDLQEEQDSQNAQIAQNTLTAQQAINENIEQTEQITELQAKNTKQDKLIQQLQANMINETTEESTQIHIEDAAELPAKLSVRGNYRQETRELENIFEYLDNIVSSIGGLTTVKNDAAGYITVNGTPEYGYINIVKLIDITDMLEDGETYTLWQEKHTSSVYGGVYLQLNINPIESGSTQHIDASTTNKTFTVNKELYAYTANLQTGSLEQAGIFNNYQNRYMIYKGTDSKDYQLPGISPSIAHPSEIKTVKNINKTHTNKNFFKVTAQNHSAGGVTYTVDDGTVSVSGTSTQASYLDLGEVILKPGTYMISGGPANGSASTQRMSIYKIIDNSVIDITAIYGTNTYKLVLTEETKIRLSYVISANQTFNNENVKPQIELGEVATNFVENEEETYSLEAQQDMLTKDYFIKEADGWKEVHVWKKLELKGIENITLQEAYNGIAQFELRNITDADGSIAQTEISAISNNFLGVLWAGSWTKDDSITNVNGLNYVRIMTSKYTTVETFKQFLAEKYAEGNPVVVYYKSTAETKLTCTEEQSAVLDKLQELDMFKGTNNIITAENLALLQLIYTVDTKSYIDNLLPTESEG